MLGTRSDGLAPKGACGARGRRSSDLAGRSLSLRDSAARDWLGRGTRSHTGTRLASESAACRRYRSPPRQVARSFTGVDHHHGSVPVPVRGHGNRARRRPRSRPRVFIPLVNPGGMLRGTRPNPRGVDLVRNGRRHGPEHGTFLLGGQRWSKCLPWYAGEPERALEVESQALVDARAARSTLVRARSAAGHAGHCAHLPWRGRVRPRRSRPDAGLRSLRIPPPHLSSVVRALGTR